MHRRARLAIRRYRYLTCRDFLSGARTELFARAPHMASPVFLENCKEVDGCTFFRLKKGRAGVMELTRRFAKWWGGLEMMHASLRWQQPWTRLAFIDVQGGSLPPPGPRSWKKLSEGNHDRVHGNTVYPRHCVQGRSGQA
eukprot:9308877-Pyramimonas_sp.AAC.1